MWLAYMMPGAVRLPAERRKSEQVMDSPSDEDVPTLVESARDEALVERRRRNLVVNHGPSFLFPRLVNYSTCLRVECSPESWVSHL